MRVWNELFDITAVLAVGFGIDGIAVFRIFKRHFSREQAGYTILASFLRNPPSCEKVIVDASHFPMRLEMESADYIRETTQ